MTSQAHSAEFIAALKAENQSLREAVALLEAELNQLKRLIYAAKSERFVPEYRDDQLPLFPTAVAGPEPKPESPKETITYERAPQRKPVRQRLPSHLPRETIVIEPEVDLTGLRKIGVEETETLDYRPAKLVVIRRVRPKYVDPKCEERGVIIGKLPARPVDKGIAEPSLLAHLTVSKYVDHMPLYRLVQQFTRQGIPLPASTAGDMVCQTGELLIALHEEQKAEVLGSGYIQADETPIPVQDRGEEERRGGKSPPKKTMHRGYYWVYHAPEKGIVVMDYQPGRGRAGPAQWLSSFQGALQSDGYAVYEEFDRWPGITGYGCWAHARRHFYEALGEDRQKAEYALEQIGRLYDVERVLREKNGAGAAPEERRRMREEHAAPVLDAFKAWLEANPGLPKSLWGKATRYALNQWTRLRRYVDDGRVEIDNNLVENAIRPIALGRKNYLFSGSHEAARRAAAIYSLLATCKKHGVNPQEWMTDVLARIPTHPQKQIRELLPHHWKQVKV